MARATKSYKTLFGLKSELHLADEMFYELAGQFGAKWNNRKGRFSLSTMSTIQFYRMQMALQKQVDAQRAAEREAVRSAFERNEFISDQQFDLFVILIQWHFGGAMGKFRSWLKNFYKLDSERFLPSRKRAAEVLFSLDEMRKRGYKVC